MNIIIFSTAYLPLVGGAETAIKGITDNISVARFILLTSRLDKTFPPREKIGNLEVYRLGFGNSSDKYLLPFFSFVKFLSIRGKLDGSILFWGMMASYGSLGAWLLKLFFWKIPFLLSIQEGNEEWEKNRFWWWVILTQANYVTALSLFLLGEVRKSGYMGRASVIPNGVDLNRFMNKESRIKNGHKIISVSRRVYKNGIDILERAFEIVKKRFPDAEIRILDKTPYEKVPEELWKADVFVRPSRTEGLGTAFLEAMGAGLPIIATSIGGIKDFLVDRETGLVVKTDDPEDLAVKIEMLFTDSALREKLIKNGRKLVEEKYQWSKIAEDMDKIFKSLV